MGISLRDSITIAPDVVFRELDGETVLLNLDSGTYFGLDAVGTRAWQLIQQHGALQQVFETMLAEYDVEPTALEKDILDLVNRLCERGLSKAADGK